MPIVNAIASLAVKDLNSSIAWYEKVIGKSPSRPMPELAEWNFERGGWLQVYQLSDRAGSGSGSVTLAVTGMEAQIAHLVNLKIDCTNVSEDERVKTVMITDPDGNHIAFAEAIDPSLAH